jgi:Uma2 family endonuclease
LAVEVLSEGNTAGEIDRKLRDYFLTGVEVVWIVDPDQRCVDIYTSPEEPTRLTETDTLDGGSILPGFHLPLHRLFTRIEKRPPRRRSTRRRK